MATHDPSVFGELLRHHRLAAGLTQEALARQTGLSARGIADLERGARRFPYAGTVQRLADKGLLQVDHAPSQRALLYRSAGTPNDFLKRASRDQAARLVQAFGPVALAAFQAELERLSPDQRKQLQDLADN